MSCMTCPGASDGSGSVEIDAYNVRPSGSAAAFTFANAVASASMFATLESFARPRFAHANMWAVPAARGETFAHAASHTLLMSDGLK